MNINDPQFESFTYDLNNKYNELLIKQKNDGNNDIDYAFINRKDGYEMSQNSNPTIDSQSNCMQLNPYTQDLSSFTSEGKSGQRQYDLEKKQIDEKELRSNLNNNINPLNYTYPDYTISDNSNDLNLFKSDDINLNQNTDHMINVNYNPGKNIHNIITKKSVRVDYTDENGNIQSKIEYKHNYNYKLFAIHYDNFSKLCLTNIPDYKDGVKLSCTNKFLENHSILYDQDIDDIDYSMLIDGVRNRYLMYWIDQMLNKLSNGYAKYMIKTFYCIDNLEEFTHFINNLNMFFDESNYSLKPVFKADDGQILTSEPDITHNGHFSYQENLMCKPWEGFDFSKKCTTQELSNVHVNEYDKQRDIYKEEFDEKNESIPQNNYLTTKFENILLNEDKNEYFYIYFNNFTYKMVLSETNLETS